MDGYPQPRNYIDGTWREGGGRGVRRVINPANGEVLAELREVSEGDIDAALQSAERGFRVWRALSPLKRSEIVIRGANNLRARVDSVARISALEEGQPFEEAKSYVMRAAEVIEWDASEGRRIYGRIIPAEPGLRHMVVREPIGPVAAFSPWNAPVFTPARKIGGVLSAGCSLILKAAEETPSTTAAVVQAFVDAGVPAGVINLLYGNPGEISERLIASPIVRMVTFTGSIVVGKRLAEQAAREMKPSVMELGGHAPVIVCDDADVQDAAKKLAFVKFRNAGQACLSPTRFWVHERVHKEFVAQFISEVKAIKVGPALAPGVTMGPLANSRRLDAISTLVEDALGCGAIAACGGRRIGTQGWFYEPTILQDVPNNARIMSEEPFGPVAVVNRFTRLDDVIEAANRLKYGLAGYIFTASAAQADRLSRELECGTIGINHLGISISGIPFGGVKESGFGREGGVEGALGYTVAKTISHLTN